MTEVLIDGVEYIPRKDLISDECLKIMCQVYGALWCEAYSDPYNESTQKFAAPLANKMSELNKILQFKK